MKDTIALIFFLLFITSVILLVVGLFNPSKALFWYKKERTKKAASRLYGIISFVTLMAFIAALPPVKENAVIETDSQQVNKSDIKQVKEVIAEAKPVYTIATIENNRPDGDIYVDVVIDDLYSKGQLIEITRQLKEEYKAKEKLACKFYYKKHAEKSTPVAGTLYLPDCSHCAYKDKDGSKIDFPFYHLEKPLADSLRALHFDTAGYKSEVSFLSVGIKNIILSSNSSKAMLVMQGTTGYYAIPLVKKTVDGKVRFYDAEEKDNYYIINSASGLVDYYNKEGLDLQQVIE